MCFGYQKKTHVQKSTFGKSLMYFLKRQPSTYLWEMVHFGENSLHIFYNFFKKCACVTWWRSSFLWHSFRGHWSHITSLAWEALFTEYMGKHGSVGPGLERNTPLPCHCFGQVKFWALPLLYLFGWSVWFALWDGRMETAESCCPWSFSLMDEHGISVYRAHPTLLTRLSFCKSCAAIKSQKWWW